MERLVVRLLSRWGTWAQLGGKWVQVLLQPWHSRGVQSLQRSFEPLGEVSQGRYVCYLPGDFPVAVGQVLTVTGEGYVICRADKVTGPGGKPLYTWALCRRKGGDNL